MKVKCLYLFDGFCFYFLSHWLVQVCRRSQGWFGAESQWYWAGAQQTLVAWVPISALPLEGSEISAGAVTWRGLGSWKDFTVRDCFIFLRHICMYVNLIAFPGFHFCSSLFGGRDRLFVCFFNIANDWSGLLILPHSPKYWGQVWAAVLGLWSSPLSSLFLLVYNISFCLSYLDVSFVF